VECKNSTACVCRFNQGFDGAATVTDKCRCNVNDGKVYYENGLPYCADVIKCAKQGQLRYNKLLSTVKLIFENYTDQSIASQIISGALNIDNIINPNSRIRVDILGSYGGVKEYLFGLFAQNQILNSVVRNYAVDTVQGIVWMRTDFLFNFFGVELNASYVGPIKFDEDNRIIIMDLSTLWFSRLDLFIQNPFAKDLIINGTCATYVTECIPYGYVGYANFNDCRNYHLTLNFGTAALTENNSTFCHYFHRNLAPYDKIHCTHMEPNGGNPNPLLAACSLKPPPFYYEQTEYDVN